MNEFDCFFDSLVSHLILSLFSLREGFIWNYGSKETKPKTWSHFLSTNIGFQRNTLPPKEGRNEAFCLLICIDICEVLWLECGKLDQAVVFIKLEQRWQRMSLRTIFLPCLFGVSNQWHHVDRHRSQSESCVLRQFQPCHWRRMPWNEDLVANNGKRESSSKVPPNQRIDLQSSKVRISVVSLTQILAVHKGDSVQLKHQLKNGVWEGTLTGQKVRLLVVPNDTTISSSAEHSVFPKPLSYIWLCLGRIILK